MRAYLTAQDLVVSSRHEEATIASSIIAGRRLNSLENNDAFQALLARVYKRPSTLVYVNVKKLFSISYRSLQLGAKMMGLDWLPMADTFEAHLDDAIITVSPVDEDGRKDVLVESYAPIGPLLLGDALTVFLLSSSTGGPEEAPKPDAPAVAPASPNP